MYFRSYIKMYWFPRSGPFGSCAQPLQTSKSLLEGIRAQLWSPSDGKWGQKTQIWLPVFVIFLYQWVFWEQVPSRYQDPPVASHIVWDTKIATPTICPHQSHSLGTVSVKVRQVIFGGRPSLWWVLIGVPSSGNSWLNAIINPIFFDSCKLWEK